MTRYDGMAFETPDIRETEHSPHVASRVPHYGDETSAPQEMVNGEGEGFETVSGFDSFAPCPEDMPECGK